MPSRRRTRKGTARYSSCRRRACRGCSSGIFRGGGVSAGGEEEGEDLSAVVDDHVELDTEESALRGLAVGDDAPEDLVEVNAGMAADRRSQ